MSKQNVTCRVADALKYAQEHCDSQDEAATVSWVAEKIADELYGTPDGNVTRFRAWSEFMAAAGAQNPYVAA